MPPLERRPFKNTFQKHLLETEAKTNQNRPLNDFEAEFEKGFQNTLSKTPFKTRADLNQNRPLTDFEALFLNLVSY